MNRDEVMKLWADAGGEVHGPNVETVSMPEDRFVEFVNDLMDKPRQLMLSPQGVKHGRFRVWASDEIYIDDDDFTFDALFQIKGDFPDFETKKAYAQECVHLLNSTVDLEKLKTSRPPIGFVYKNHRGEVEQRAAIPIRIYWGHTEYYPHDQWLLHAWDELKKAERTFAVLGISTILMGGL